MDFLDEVISLEENAYKEGLEIGKKRAEEMARASSSKIGKEEGYCFANEYGFIRGYTEIVDKEEHLREKHQKIIKKILDIKLSPEMIAEELNQGMINLRCLFKQLLSLLKIRQTDIASDELY